jgi:DNA-binding transcriptional ArsR family regulator
MAALPPQAQGLGASNLQPLLSELMHALHNELARQVLVHLAFGSRDVTSLVKQMERDQGNVSKHLASLRELGVIERQRTKKNCIYRLGSPVSCTVAEGKQITVRIAGRHQTEVTFKTALPSILTVEQGRSAFPELKLSAPTTQDVNEARPDVTTPAKTRRR